MPRDIPVGSGSLLVNFHGQWRLRDLYWPHVGQENHAEGGLSRFGVWLYGQFSRASDEGWDRSVDHTGDTLVLTVEESLAKLRHLNRCSESGQPLVSVDDDA